MGLHRTWGHFLYEELTPPVCVIVRGGLTLQPTAQNSSTNYTFADVCITSGPSEVMWEKGRANERGCVAPKINLYVANVKLLWFWSLRRTWTLQIKSEYLTWVRLTLNSRSHDWPSLKDYLKWRSCRFDLNLDGLLFDKNFRSSGCLINI